MATQLVVRTPAGTVQVFAQNTGAGGHVATRGAEVTLSWSPEATFVVDRDEALERTEPEEVVG